MPLTVVRGFGMDTNFADDRKIPGLGQDIGQIQLDDGSTIDAGKVLLRGSCNSRLYEPLEKLVEPGDVHIWKNRLSGFHGKSEAEKILKERVIRAVVFAGCNTDQCVLGSLMDACWKAWDCVLLNDGTGTTSPEYVARAVG